MAMQMSGREGRPGQADYRRTHLKSVIGERVRKLRKEAGLTQADLARMSKVSKSVLGAIEDGFGVNVLELSDISMALDCSLEALIPCDWESQ